MREVQLIWNQYQKSNYCNIFVLVLLYFSVLEPQKTDFIYLTLSYHVACITSKYLPFRYWYFTFLCAFWLMEKKVVCIGVIGKGKKKPCEQSSVFLAQRQWNTCETTRHCSFTWSDVFVSDSTALGWAWGEEGAPSARSLLLFWVGTVIKVVPWVYLHTCHRKIEFSVHVY